MIKLDDKQVCAELQNALASGDKDVITNAWENYRTSIVNTIKEDIKDYAEKKDEQILMNRGYKVLTNKEKEFYNALIKGLKSGNKKDFQNVFTSLEDDAMPQTIIEDVFRDLQQLHPLLSKIKFVNVKYLTKWILSNNDDKTASWGALNSAITKEITDTFEVIDLKQNKLSAYALIENDMLDLGATFLESYVRASLMESIANGLEYAIIKGNGKNMPIGLARDISHGVTIDSTNGYPMKDSTASGHVSQAITVEDFTPVNYGSIVANFTNKESWEDESNNLHGGSPRNFTSVDLIVNQKEYLTKIMPATTMLTGTGEYAKNLFPFPTNVIISNQVPDNQAIMCQLDEYFLGIGTSKSGVIEYSDDFKFLDDMRTFKVKMHADGRAQDNTSAIILDITNIQPCYMNVVSVVDTP